MRNYYRQYLTLHQNKYNKLLHFLGQMATITFVVVVIYYKLYFLLLLTPFVVYPFAWSGDLFFVKNKTAAFKNPIKAKLSDWIMFGEILLGRIKLK